MIGQIIEMTFVAVMVAMILGNAEAFSSAASAIGDLYVKVVKALQNP